MFCRSCGKELDPQDKICPNCGVSQETGQNYCPNCGNNNPANAADCIVCGKPLRAHNNIPKNKTAAVLLAVFLGFWAWLYTYKRNGWKFWLNLILSILTGWVWSVVAWIWAIIDTTTKPVEWYENY